jgi:hypothetical protein
MYIEPIVEKDTEDFSILLYCYLYCFIQLFSNLLYFLLVTSELEYTSTEWNTSNFTDATRLEHIQQKLIALC